MKLKKIYEFLDSISPFELQEKWDNSGLLVGNPKGKIDQIYISLDLDLDLVKKLKPNSLVITHHPLIFTPLKKVTDSSYSEKILKQLIKKDIALISMHTNIDKTHLNKYVGEKILNFEFTQSDDFILTAKINMKFEELVDHLKTKLNIKTLKITKTKDHINTISLTTGAGMSLLPFIKTDCFLTGDIKYHEAMDAYTRDISLIDIGHYESEIHFCSLLEELLDQYLKKNQKKAIILASQNPFKYT